MDVCSPRVGSDRAQNCKPPPSVVPIAPSATTIPPMRMGRSIGALVVIALATMQLACTNANVELNRVSVPLKLRRPNHTRATTVPSLDDPIEHSSPRNDGCFVGLAL